MVCHQIKEKFLHFSREKTKLTNLMGSVMDDSLFNLTGKKLNLTNTVLRNCIYD